MPCTAKRRDSFFAMLIRFVFPKDESIPVPSPQVSVMPCTAKKHETLRSEFRGKGGAFDCDLVITTREFGHILR